MTPTVTADRARPVNDGLLYVEPFYIQGQASSTSFPQLTRVLVWYADRGRGRADPPAGADQGDAERPGGDPRWRRRGRGDG
ncbi:MAG TPA: hypothetical protein VIJ00_09360 [Nakamurella sp.]